MKRLSGIYRIRNIVNGKGYVGSSKDLVDRWDRHQFELDHNVHHSEHLQYAWNKYGSKAFEFKILEIIKNPTRKKLVNREQYWINKYDSANDEYGYNMYPEAGSSLGFRFDSTIKLKNDIIKFAKKNGYLPSAVGKTKKERKMGKALGEYIYTDASQYDPVVVRVLRKYPMWLEYRTIQAKNLILKFIKNKGHWPSYTHKKEKSLAHKLWVYIDKKSLCYDMEFEKKVRQYPTYQEWYRNKLKKEILKFVKEYKYRPSRQSKDKKEIHLYGYLKYLRNDKKQNYDKMFDKLVSQYPTWQTFKKLQKVK